MSRSPSWSFNLVLAACTNDGATTNVAAAITAGIRIGIGSDWSPSGSKNLLGEIKVAWLVAQQLGGIARHDIVAMATRTAARILGWEAVLGTIEPCKRADLIVVDGTSADPYDQLIRAKETDLTLVVNGVPRYGRNLHVCAWGEGRGVDDKRSEANTVSQAGCSRSGCGSDQAVAADDAQESALQAACTSEGAGAATASRRGRPQKFAHDVAACAR